MPALCYWKNHLQGGKVNEEVMLSMDIYPTLLHLANFSKDKDLLLDGVDLWDCISKDKPLKERKLFWMHTDRLVMRDGNMKLIRQRGGIELYDLTNDPQEKINLANQNCYREKVTQMIAESDQWHRRTATGFPLEREIGVKVKTKWPCHRDLKKFNKGKKWKLHPCVNKKK